MTELTQVSRRQVLYWIKTDVLRPQIEASGRRGTVRLFSFSDLLELRIAAWLRDKISLQLIRKIVHRLRDVPRHSVAPLASVRFGVIELRTRAGEIHQEVVVQEADGAWESARRPGQLVLQIDIPIHTLREDLERRIHTRRSRRRQIGKVERRRGVMGSAPVVAGTRVPTAAVWRLHEAGRDTQDILESYPGLLPEDVQAALDEESRRRQPA